MGEVLDKEDIRVIVRWHIADVRRCYCEHGGEDPPWLSIRFTIGPDGRVTEASALDPDGVGAPELSACIVAEIGGWTFPPPEHGGFVTVSYPRT